MKKIIFFGLIMVFFITTGLGCKGQTQEEQQAVRPVTLNYWTVFDDVKQLREFAVAYKQLRPYVTVNIRQVRYEEFDKLFANALADDVGPDIVSMQARWLPKYQTRLSPMPKSVVVSNIRIKSQITKETEVVQETVTFPTVNTIRSQYVGAVADDAIINGEIFGLPLAIDTMALYYNKDLLDKSGVPLPPRSWAELNDAVKKTTKFNTAGGITQSGIAMGTARNIPNAFDIVSLLMTQNGVTMASGKVVKFAEGMDRPSPNLPAFEALRFYTDFAKPTQDVYTWNDQKGNALDDFIRGASVFYFGFAFDRARIKAGAPQMNLNVIPVPQLNDALPANIANYWLESVVAKSKNQNLAWDFVRFISSQSNVKLYVEATKQPSPIRSQIAEQQNDPEMSAFALQALTAKNWYHGNDLEASQKAFQDMIVSYAQPIERDDLRVKAQIIQRAAQVVQQTY